MVMIFLFLIFLSLPLQGCYAQDNNETAAQAEKDDQRTWDFGRVKEGEVVRHAFVLKNEFVKAMRIEDVSTSCGCTVSSVATKILLPGEATDMEVKFNSKGYSGQVQQYVYVHTDDPVHSIVRFIIKADVIK
ncbi:MAG: DUF1573 domain-containing protein [Candidatus Omnitrophota bacterium]